MSETTRGLLTILVGAAVMGYFLYRNLFRKHSRKTRLMDRARQNGWVTTGYCVKSRKTAGRKNQGSGSHAYKWDGRTAVFEYTVDGKKYRIRQKTLQGDHEHYADSVQVFYDKSNPRRAVTRSTVSGGQASWWLAVILTPLAMFATVQVLMRLFP